MRGEGIRARLRQRVARRFGRGWVGSTFYWVGVSSTPDGVGDTCQGDDYGVAVSPTEKTTDDWNTVLRVPHPAVNLSWN